MLIGSFWHIPSTPPPKIGKCAMSSIPEVGNRSLESLSVGALPTPLTICQVRRVPLAHPAETKHGLSLATPSHPLPWERGEPALAWPGEPMIGAHCSPLR